MVLRVMLTDENYVRNCFLDASVVASPSAVESQNEDMGNLENIADYDVPRRRHNLTHLPLVPWCTICCKARTMDDRHPVILHDHSINALPEILYGCAEIKIKGGTTPMRMLVVV